MKIATKEKTNNGVTFTFDNGESVVVTMDMFEDEMLLKLAIHGATQKLGDSYASSTTVSEAVEKFYDTLSNLKAGVWNGGRAASAGGIWVEAIANATGKSMEESKAMFDSKNEAEQKAIKKIPAIVAAKSAIDLSRLQAKAAKAPAPESVDTDSLFA